jgi:ABC-type Na+ efflux pump permease subunit
MKFLDIAIKDLYQIFKDWKTAIFLVAGPIIFTLMFGFMFGGFGSPDTTTDHRLPVWVSVGEDTPVTQSFLAYLENSSVIRMTPVDPARSIEELQQAVNDEEAAGVLLIPEGFTATLIEKAETHLEIILDENTTTGITVQQEIGTAANRLQTAARIARTSVQTYQTFDDKGDSNQLYHDAFMRALQAWEAPPVTAIETRTAPTGSQATSDENAFAHSLPGMMAQFTIAGLIGAAEIIIQERKSGALERLLGTAVPKFSILAGHWLAVFGMIFLQFIVLVSFGQIFLRLDFLAAPWATLILSIASCAYAASLGLLIGILAKMPEQSAIFTLIPMFIFSGLGGAWVPLEFLGEQVRQVARFTPVYWVMTGFKDILLRGATLADIWPSLLALAGFFVLFFIPAVLIFYRKRT